MDESLLSILCDRGIWRNGFQHNYILFRKDGTGKVCVSRCSKLSRLLIFVKLSAGVEFNWPILAEFKWKVTDVKPSDQVFGDSESPRLVSLLNMEITLTKHLNPARNKEPEPKHINVTDDALRPKLFNVRLEEGIFPLPEDFDLHGPGVKTPYEKRLVFDPSPYPPASEWKQEWKEHQMLDEGEGKNYWDETQFVNYWANWEEFSAAHRSIGL